MTDAAQFTETYRQHSLPIYRFALHMSGSEAIADEVTQDTFMVLIRSAGKLRCEARIDGRLSLWRGAQSGAPASGARPQVSVRGRCG